MILDDIRAAADKLAALPPRPSRIEFGWAAFALVRIAARPAVAELPGFEQQRLAAFTGVPVFVVNDDRDPWSWRALATDGSVMDSGLLP